MSCATEGFSAMTSVFMSAFYIQYGASRARTCAHMHELTIPKKNNVSKNLPLSFEALESTQTSSNTRRIQARRSGVHGRGMFAVQNLAKDEVVIEYVGEIIDWGTALDRHPHDPKDPNHTFYFHLEGGRVIDAKHGGNSSRWINHSCNPNCEADAQGDRVFIKTLRDINAGEELFYDYGLVIDGRHTKKLKAEYQCWCGAHECRGTMLAKK